MTTNKGDTPKAADGLANDKQGVRKEAKLDNRTRVAFALDDSGLYPYPEFVDLFTAVFDNVATKEQTDEAERLISGGMNRKTLAKHLDAYLTEVKGVRI